MAPKLVRRLSTRASSPSRASVSPATAKSTQARSKRLSTKAMTNPGVSRMRVTVSRFGMVQAESFTGAAEPDSGVRIKVLVSFITARRDNTEHIYKVQQKKK